VELLIQGPVMLIAIAASSVRKKRFLSAIRRKLEKEERPHRKEAFCVEASFPVDKPNVAVSSC
jgi:hypothetical protein